MTNRNVVPQTTLKRLFRNWIPHPLLTLMLVFLWIALQNSTSYGNLVVAIVLASSSQVHGKLLA